METDRINFNKQYIKVIANEVNNDLRNFKKIFYILIILIILLNISSFLFLHFHDKESRKNLYISNPMKSKYNFAKYEKNCIFAKNKLKNRIKPLDFENELLFFIDLIVCKIPFSFIRFADGENAIMKGLKLTPRETIDKWNFNPSNKNFQNSLIESSSICMNPNSFIGLPCKNWIEISNSILSFSNCSSAKYMSYSTLFVNKNFPIFKDWIIDFINSSNRWKIILVANSIIGTNITWAYKFFPIPVDLVGYWEKYSINLLSELSKEAKNNNLIFFISAGPASNIIISYLTKINNKNQYIDFGSSIEFITKGYSTRPYSKNDKSSQKSCESFFLRNRTIFYQR